MGFKEDDSVLTKQSNVTNAEKLKLMRNIFIPGSPFQLSENVWHLSVTGLKCTIWFATFLLKMVRAASIACCALIKTPPGKLMHILDSRWPDPQG